MKFILTNNVAAINISYNKKCSGRKYLNDSFYPPGPGERSFHFTPNLLHCGFNKNIPLLYSSFLIQQFWISPLNKTY